MSEIDDRWSLACRGGERAFGEWAGRVERPVHLSLRPFARAVDTESVVQETLVRMWHRSRDPDPTLTGENASLRYAIRVAHNLARNVARKHRREHLLPPEDLPHEPGPTTEPSESDPLLRRIIQRCLDALPGPLRRALRVRLHGGHRPAREQATEAGMTVNTFHQNIVRARRNLGGCLEKHGVHEHEAFR